MRGVVEQRSAERHPRSTTHPSIPLVCISPPTPHHHTMQRFLLLPHHIHREPAHSSILDHTSPPYLIVHTFFPHWIHSLNLNWFPLSSTSRLRIPLPYFFWICSIRRRHSIRTPSAEHSIGGYELRMAHDRHMCSPSRASYHIVS